ncbi:hypothetical protein MCP1_140036 [Candidatus Terasakiella magnetica]|nr:hypothetical protein MCP1_140036 [Candidatus Terasakiella magnetica]
MTIVIGSELRPVGFADKHMKFAPTREWPARLMAREPSIPEGCARRMRGSKASLIGGSPVILGIRGGGRNFVLAFHRHRV